jgi:hypothetical protein
MRLRSTTGQTLAMAMPRDGLQGQEGQEGQEGRVSQAGTWDLAGGEDRIEQKPECCV